MVRVGRDWFVFILQTGQHCPQRHTRLESRQDFVFEWATLSATLGRKGGGSAPISQSVDKWDSGPEIVTVDSLPAAQRS
jgi:hypothetical protein